MNFRNENHPQFGIDTFINTTIALLVS